MCYILNNDPFNNKFQSNLLSMFIVYTGIFFAWLLKFCCERFTSIASN